MQPLSYLKNTYISVASLAAGEASAALAPLSAISASALNTFI